MSTNRSIEIAVEIMAASYTGKTLYETGRQSIINKIALQLDLAFHEGHAAGMAGVGLRDLYYQARVIGPDETTVAPDPEAAVGPQTGGEEPTDTSAAES